MNWKVRNNWFEKFHRNEDNRETNPLSAQHSPQAYLIHNIPGKGRFGDRGTEPPTSLSELWVGVFFQKPEDLLCLNAEIEGSLDAITGNGHEDDVGQPSDGLDLAKEPQHAHMEFRGCIRAQLEVCLDNNGQVA